MANDDKKGNLGAAIGGAVVGATVATVATVLAGEKNRRAIGKQLASKSGQAVRKIKAAGRKAQQKAR